MSKNRNFRRTLAKALATLYIFGVTVGSANAYAFNQIVPDVRQSVSLSGGSACPVRSHILTSAPATRAIRWSTAVGANPTAIVTQDQTPAGRLAEIEQVIIESMGVWQGVTGTTLQPLTTQITRTTTQSACGSDGLNSICFDQADFAFTPGVLAFTRVITADAIGTQLANSAPASEVGQILDADIYFNPSDSSTTYATPFALSASTHSYDFESLLIHEMGHSLGFSHSAVWNAMMFPFAPVPGTFSGARPSIRSARRTSRRRRPHGPPRPVSRSN